MAVVSSENDLLNDTLECLRSTPLGQLTYYPDWKINNETSNQLSCSFESFLNEFTDAGVNESLLDLNLVENEIISSLDDKSESGLEAKVNETNNPGISVNFDVENERSIKWYHDDCRGNAEQRNLERAQIHQRRIENLKNDNQGKLREVEKHLAEEKRNFELTICELEKQDAEEMKKREGELNKEAMIYKQKLDEIFIKSLTEESLAAKDREEKRIALENLNKSMNTTYNEVLFNIEVIQRKIANFRYMEFVDSQDIADITTKLNENNLNAKKVLLKCESCNNVHDTEQYLEIMHKLNKTTLAIDCNVEKMLNSAQEKAKDVLKRKEENERAKLEESKQELLRQQEEKQRLQQKKLEDMKKLSEEKPPNENEKSKLPAQKIAEFVSDKALVEYTELQEYLHTVQASYKEFISDPKQTKYKFDLQKAVNIPINALSAHSSSQLNDKINRLVALLSGNNVEVGGKRINCKGHPSGLIFCKDLIAKKLVTQGAQQVSSSPQSAFLYAAVIVGIWSKFPDVGKLILAHFHKSYPYLVPYYMPQIEGQSNNDYHKALGYSVNNDKIEDENHFLKKFSGTVQLYAAVVSSKGATKPDHPHGIHNGWTWLARTLNLTPHPSVTATMLFEFIKVAGHLLMERYRKQFQKLLLMLFKDFIPAIDKVTPPEKLGPTQRLKSFLDECVKTQRIAVPKGYLTERWWQTGHF